MKRPKTPVNIVAFQRCFGSEKFFEQRLSIARKLTWQLLAVGRWFPPGTPVSSTRKLISSSFHRLDMTLAVAEALNPNTPNQNHGVLTYPSGRCHDAMLGP